MINAESGWTAVVPIQLMYDRWTDEYSSYWAGRMADIKYHIETAAMSSDDTD